MGRTIATITTLTAGAALAGCVVVAGDFDDDMHFTSSRHSGDIMGSVIDSRGVTITSRSYGCTDKSSYDVDVDRDDGRYEVSFERVRADNCRALLRDGVQLNWSLEELSIPEGAEIVVETRSRS